MCIHKYKNPVYWLLGNSSVNIEVRTADNLLYKKCVLHESRHVLYCTTNISVTRRGKATRCLSMYIMTHKNRFWGEMYST
jgi:hypothetical protein